MKLWRYVVLALVCALPVSALSLEQGEFSSVDSAIQNVRIFVGFTISQEEKLVAPTVVTLIESHKEIDCRFVTFPVMPVALKNVIPTPPEGGRIVFEGRTEDPRGWTVTWTAELIGNEIKGTFKQPHDEGKFILLEAYTE